MIILLCLVIANFSSQLITRFFFGFRSLHSVATIMTFRCPTGAPSPLEWILSDVHRMSIKFKRLEAVSRDCSYVS